MSEPQVKSALLHLEVTCPECAEVIQRIKLDRGANAGIELECEWDNMKIKIPDVLVKG